MFDNEIINLAAKLGLKGNGNAFHCPNHHDNTPSLFINRKDGKILFKCHPCGAGGNLIGLVKFCKRYEKGEAINWLREKTSTMRNYIPVNRKIYFDNAKKELITILPYDKFKYFTQFGITEKVLNANRVFALESFQRGELTLYSKQTNPMFAYQIEDNYYKIYQPLAQNKKYKFSYMGQHTKKTKFGLSNCKKDLNYIIVTGGEKDVLTLQSMGFNAVSFNSESDVNTELCEELVNDYKIVFVLYDNDDTGIKFRNTLCKIKGVYPINEDFEIVPKLFKDVSDYAKEILIDRDSVSELKNSLQSEIDLKIKRYANMQFLTDEVFFSLPQFIQDVLYHFESVRDMELILLSMITVFSSTFHNLKSVYNGKVCFPNLFSFILGSPASGKGKMENAILLIKEYYDKLDANGKGKKSFQVPANSTKTAIIQNLSANNGLGIIFDTEADSLTSANRGEHGDFSDLLRKGFHNEPISISRVDNDKVIKIELPKFAVLLSGTFEQRDKLIQNNENGLLTRFIYFTLPQDNTFDDVFLSKESIDVKLQPQILKFQTFLEEFQKGINLNCKADEEIEQEIVAYFRTKTEQFKNDTDANGVIKRMGLISYKIMMILAASRLIYDSVYPNEIIISREDFNVAIAIAEHCLENSILYQKTFEKHDTSLKLLNMLPDKFTTQDINKCATVLNKDPRTLRNNIKKLISSGKIKNIKHGHYAKK